MTADTKALLEEIATLKARIAHLESVRLEFGSALEALSLLPVPVLIKDADLRWVWGNEALCEMFHLDQDALAGLTDEDVHGWENANEINKYDRMILAEDGPVGYEKILQFKDVCHHLSVVKILWYPKDNGTPYVLTVLRDITATCLAEKAARESRERFHKVINNTPTGLHVYSLDKSGIMRFIDANPAADLLTRTTSKDLLGKPVHEAFPSMQSVGLIDIYHTVLATGEPWSGASLQLPGLADQVFTIHAFPISAESVAVHFEDTTRATLARKSIEASENRYRNLFHNSPIPMWEHDYSLFKKHIESLRQQGISDPSEHLQNCADKLHEILCSINVLGMNRACVSMLDAESCEQASKHIENMLDHKGRLVVLNHLLLLDQGQSEIMFMINARTIHNDLRILQAHLSVLPGHEKELDRVLVSCVDETERIQARKAVTESEERLQLVLSATKDGIWDWDIASGKTYFSPSYYTMLGYEPTEFEATISAWGELLHPEERERILEDAYENTKKDSEFSAEFRMARKDNTWCWILSRGRVVERDVQGKPLRAVGSHTDITAVKQVQEQLREHKNLFESMSDNLLDMLWAKDTEGRYLFANKALRTNLLLSGNEKVEGKDNQYFASLPHQTENEFLLSGVCTQSDSIVLSTAEPGQFEEQGKINGVTRVFDIRKSPFLDRQGNLMGIVGMGRDITEKKQAQSILLKAKEAAETAAKSKDQFLANMSHEIRTPMNGVLGMLQLLNATSLTKEQSEYVDTALESGRGLLAVINDILDFSKMQAPGFALSRQQFSLQDTIRTVLRNFSVQARDKRIGLTYEVDSRIPKLLVGDDARLRQILFNLVGNAVKFTHAGSVRVRVDKVCKQGAKLLIGIEVADTGIGIPDALLTTVFDPFTQADTSFSRPYQGTGLGLGIVRSLIDRMGGTITINSEAEQGSEIYVTMLLELPDAEGVDGEYSEPHPDPQCPLQILIVEDDAVNRFTIKRYLEKTGFAVTEAYTGKEAVAVTRQKRFDCILMDIQMPAMDGVKATKKIREEEEKQGLSPVPIVALTAHAMQGDRERFLKAGMDSYVSKPLELDELTAAVNAAVEKHQSTTRRR